LMFFPSVTFAFPLAFVGCVGRSGGANTRPLQVMPLNPVMLVTLADSDPMSVASSSLLTLTGGVGAFGEPCPW